LYSATNKRLFVISENPACVIEVNPADQTRKILANFTQKPTGAVLSKNTGHLFVTLAGPAGKIAEIDIANQKIVRSFSTDGHTPVAPVLSADEQTIYACNRFQNDVVAIDLKSSKIIKTFKVVREPISLVLSNDGNSLFAGNFLPAGPANKGRVNSVISVIDLKQGSIKNLELPSGSNSIGAMTLTPDGRYIYLTHILGRFEVPTTQIERGWINTNALSIIDVEKKEVLATVLLDDVELGFANPLAVACSPDNKLLLVTSFGGNELSIINRADLHKAIESNNSQTKSQNVTNVGLENDLALMFKINRKRIALPGYGPNSMNIVGSDLFITEYYSGIINLLTLDNTSATQKLQIALGDKETADNIERYGEMLFNSSELCFQKWQSCLSCHPEGRSDGLNWDLMNDGIGNPKNTKSMLLSHQTPPAMWLGVRASAEVGVRAGMRFIQFSNVDEDQAKAIDVYLKSMKPEVSPYLVNNKLSGNSNQGKKLFKSEGCIICHPAPLYTDLKKYDLNYAGASMDKGKEFDTPSLTEAWRNAPYLHDGSAKTIDEMIKVHNPFGTSSKLTEKELADLSEYVLSL
jgi:DNA-binding beta-propeller fold protein YncE